MKNVKNFMIILISVFLTGMCIFYYSMGIDLTAKMKENFPDVGAIPFKCDGVNVKHGYVNTDKDNFKIPTAEDNMADYTMDALDKITKEISGMTTDDMMDFAKHLPKG